MRKSPGPLAAHGAAGFGAVVRLELAPGADRQVDDLRACGVDTCLHEDVDAPDGSCGYHLAGTEQTRQAVLEVPAAGERDRIVAGVPRRGSGMLGRDGKRFMELPAVDGAVT